MAVDLHVEKPEEEKSAEESVDAEKDFAEGIAEDSEQEGARTSLTVQSALTA